MKDRTSSLIYPQVPSGYRPSGQKKSKGVETANFRIQNETS
ncbi:hypothetical protein HNQ76_000799 [Thermosulfuriphilus ammonigenes]|nr:hypothetical protein [Thermosulfuriphilus ammonigenes]MBA2848453.1 hypothetical protein [Thermosulfuriphilus ammonigenes]